MNICYGYNISCPAGMTNLGTHGANCLACRTNGWTSETGLNADTNYLVCNTDTASYWVHPPVNGSGNSYFLSAACHAGLANISNSGDGTRVTCACDPGWKCNPNNIGCTQCPAGSDVVFSGTPQQRCQCNAGTPCWDNVNQHCVNMNHAHSTDLAAGACACDYPPYVWNPQLGCVVPPGPPPPPGDPHPECTNEGAHWVIPGLSGQPLGSCSCNETTPCWSGQDSTRGIPGTGPCVALPPGHEVRRFPSGNLTGDCPPAGTTGSTGGSSSSSTLLLGVAGLLGLGLLWHSAAGHQPK